MPVQQVRRAACSMVARSRVTLSSHSLVQRLLRANGEAIMGVSISRQTVADVGEAVRITIAEEETGSQVLATIEVPAQASVLSLAVTDSGPGGESRAPQNVHVYLFDPEGRRVEIIAQQGALGRGAFLLGSPMPGTWKIQVEYGGGASAEVSAATLHRGWLGRLRARAGWFRCKTCKLLLQSLVLSTAIHLAPLVAAGAVAQGIPNILAALGPGIRDILTQTLTLAPDGLPPLLSMLLPYVDGPVDDVLKQLCGWLGLCP
jgi:hypothetical protein